MHEFVTDLKGPDQLADPRMKSVYTLWDQKKQKLGHYPGWADFTISEIAETMPHMAVVDYLPHEDRFRIRFSGSVYDTLLGRDVTGSYFDEMPDAYGLESRARRACTGNAVLIDGLPLTWAKQAHRTYRGFSLPMQTQADGKVDQLLYMMVLTDED